MAQRLQAKHMGVPAAPGVHGLVVSAVKPNDGDDRWVQGLVWLPERCDITYDVWSLCVDHTKELQDIPDLARYTPVGFNVAEKCGTHTPRDAERIRRQVDAITSHAVAVELWSGAETQADAGTPDNPFFTAAGAATVVAGVYATAVEGLAALEGAAMRDARGQQVFLHVPVEWVMYLADRLDRVGGLLYTKLGNVVVADSGYPAGLVAYATGPVQVRLTAIEVNDNLAQTVDRTTNEQTIIGERMFAATYDPCSLHEVTVTALG